MPIIDVTSYRECAERLLSLIKHIQIIEAKLKLPYNDTRIVALKNCDAHASSVVMVQKLLSHFHEGNLPVELLQSLMDLDEKIVDVAVSRLDDTLRLSFITMYQFQVENMLRNLLVALKHPNPPSSFYKITRELLKLITVNDKPNKLQILNVSALIRNSLHSNGIHNPPTPSSTQIEIDTVQYDFIYGKSVNCAGWAYIILALNAGLDVIEEILFSSEIKILPNPIEDRYASFV